ncbi:MAG TPA: histidine kinase [Chitinophagaceae bacterium]|nr:histidine kinase [Chitinophagaceae bacterium]
MYKYCIIVSFFFSFATIKSIGQLLNEKSFTRYATGDGLSDNTVTGIEQDAAGYIWLATFSGLNRYDGSRFIKYHSTNDSLSPATENFVRINRLDKDRIAFLPMGLHVVNTKTNERRNLFIPYHNKQYQYKYNMVERAAGDDKGNLFVLTRSGFYHYDKNYRLLFRFDYFSEKDLPTEHFYFGNDLLELDDKRLLITARPGLYIYNKEKKEFLKLSPGQLPLLDEFTHDNTYYKFFQVKRGKLLVTKSESDTIFYIDISVNKKIVSRSPFTFSNDIIQWRSKLIPVNDSLFYITGQTSGFYSLKLNPSSGSVQLMPEKYFADYLCNDLLTDKENRLWVATNNGLFRQNDNRHQVQTTYISDELKAKFPNLSLTSIYVTSDKIYAGARAGAGLLVFDKKTFRFENSWFNGSDVKNNTVFKIVSPYNSSLIIGSLGPISLYNNTNGSIKTMHPPGWNPNDWAGDLLKDSRGDIWVSSSNIYRYRPAEKKFILIPFSPSMPSVPVAIAEDRNGNIWMAGHGIIRYNVSYSRFDEKIDSFPYIKMPDKQVGPLAIDRDNNIWFGSANNGLIGYNIDKKLYRHFTTGNGLPGNDISALIIIGNKLWIACYAGLACLDLTSLQIKRFGKDEGFPEMPLQNRAGFFYDSSQQQLYIGFSTALVRFNPYEILTPQKQPSVFIENMDIGNKKIYFPGRIVSATWKQNDLKLTIGVINFNDGRSQGYAYRIFKNSNSPWQQLGNQPSFSVSNLSPGKHRIQVKVFSLNNQWPEQVKEIIVEVLPPFWQKDWFRIMATLLSLALIFLFIQWRIAVARKKEMEKTHVQKLKADDYKNKYELEQITNYFSSSLADKKSADEVLWDVAENLIGRLNYLDCMIYLWNDDKTKMIQKAAYGLKAKPELLSEQVFDVKSGQGVVGYVMQTKEPVLIKDTRTDSRYRVDEVRRLSEICVPIIHNNELLGIIDSEHPELNYYSERDLKILTTIATLIGNKLKQLESEQTLEVKEQELSNINEQLAEAKLSALQAQMNPHFVFNALNSIKRMILDGDDDKASRYLSKFAHMIRMTLNHSKETFVTIAENIEYIKTYLGMEQLRFNDSFKWTITIADNIDADETRIASLMIQPLVENAIWHGLLHSEKEKILSISFTRNEDTITCIIEDNGIGIRKSQKAKEQHQSNHRSVGLDNLYNRIKILNEKFNAGYSLIITDCSENNENCTGTRVTLKFIINDN